MRAHLAPFCFGAVMNQSETSLLLKALREQREAALTQIARDQEKFPPATIPGRKANPWENHYSLAMCARTKGHMKRIAAKLMANGIKPEFDSAGRLKVNSMNDQRRKMKIVLGPKTVNYDSYY